MFPGGFPGRGDWKSVAADRLRRMGREDEAKALYGIKDPKHRHDERTAREWRKEAKRRARSNAGSTSFFARLRRLLRL